MGFNTPRTAQSHTIRVVWGLSALYFFHWICWETCVHFGQSTSMVPSVNSAESFSCIFAPRIFGGVNASNSLANLFAYREWMQWSFSHRNCFPKKGAQPLTLKFAVTELRGDWEWHVNALNLVNRWSSIRCCFKCPATSREGPLQYTNNFDDSAPWLGQEFSHVEFLNRVAKPGPLCFSALNLFADFVAIQEPNFLTLRVGV